MHHPTCRLHSPGKEKPHDDGIIQLTISAVPQGGAELSSCLLQLLTFSGTEVGPL